MPKKDDKTTLKAIFDGFIKPITDSFSSSEESANAYAALDNYFRPDRCKINEYVVDSEIQYVPGKPQPWHDADAKRFFDREWKVLVRYDLELPNFVDVEFFKSWKHKESHMFRMKPHDYEKYIAKHLRSTNAISRHRN
jgi:hypothetical protein